MNPLDGLAVPDSPYLAQMQQGFSRLRFMPALEREFHDEFVEQHLARTRLGFAVAIVLYIVFLLVRTRIETGPAAHWGLVIRPISIAAMLLTLTVTYLRRWREALPLFTLVSYACFAAGATAMEIVEHRYHIDRHYEGLILVSFHVYVFSGLLFRPALIAGASIFLAYLIGGALGGLPGREWPYELLFIGLTHVIGGTALYSIERVERENFLRRRLFGVLATQDGLTGLFNRMAFFRQFEMRARQAARDGVAIGVMLLDVDHFKSYNDRYGHLEGDACLRAVAGALRQEFRRPSDMAARFGGEEFIGLWYGIQPQALRTLADQVRAAVQALAIAHRDAPAGRVTASIGAVACVPAETESLLELVKRADTALYEAKQKGRNRIVVEILPPALNAPRPDGRRSPTISAS